MQNYITSSLCFVTFENIKRFVWHNNQASFCSHDVANEDGELEATVANEERQVSPPTLNDEAPSGDHVIAPTPLSTSASISSVASVTTATCSTLFSGSPVHPAVTTLISEPQSYVKDIDNVNYFKDEECTIDVEVSRQVVLCTGLMGFGVVYSFIVSISICLHLTC